VLVTDGVYDQGGVAVVGMMTNRVALTNPVVLQSDNGPSVTWIVGAAAAGGGNGDGAVRCAYVGANAVLSGFTLTNGHTRVRGVQEVSGGGALCELSGVLTNCTLTGNSASSDGGGAVSGTLSHCTLIGNSAQWDGGGGAAWSTLNFCTLTGNSADDGGGVYRGALNHCILTANSAVDAGGGASLSMLNHCTLTGNWTEWNGSGGGGTWASTLNHCTLTGNSSYGEHGGGAARGTLNDCVLTGNSGSWGGGVADGTLSNCTLAGNSAEYGGGVYRSTLNNCIVYYNAANNGSNCIDAALNFCCTTPLPGSGAGNLTTEPHFVDRLNGNLRLQSNSPCINAGNNAYVSGATDLDGRPRIVGGTVDMGACEYQGPGMGEFIDWLQLYALPTDGSADFTDFDADRLNNWQEWCCRTDPTNALSVLRLRAPSPAGSDVNVTWQSVAGVSYFLERSTNLGASPPFHPLATDLPGQAGTSTYTETNAVGAPLRVYRVGVTGP
jgi:hypothetical protein